jgi:DNA (cytosine-5)-methyltransferase 1
MPTLTSLELCAGAGGQALGLERAGFDHLALVEIDPDACETLHMNRPEWNIERKDLKELDAAQYQGVDLLAAGLPCPPFSVAGQQLGDRDERNLFPAFLRIVDEALPKALLVENVRGLMSARFDPYRRWILRELEVRGYRGEWSLLDASQFGVSQYRQRAFLVAFRRDADHQFSWPMPSFSLPVSVGTLLEDLMSENGWRLAAEWRRHASGIAPTIVGGSKKHGGPDQRRLTGKSETRCLQSWPMLSASRSRKLSRPGLRSSRGQVRCTHPTAQNWLP